MSAALAMAHGMQGPPSARRMQPARALRKWVKLGLGLGDHDSLPRGLGNNDGLNDFVAALRDMLPEDDMQRLGIPPGSGEELRRSAWWRANVQPLVDADYEARSTRVPPNACCCR